MCRNLFTVVFFLAEFVFPKVAVLEKVIFYTFGCSGK